MATISLYAGDSLNMAVLMVSLVLLCFCSVLQITRQQLCLISLPVHFRLTVVHCVSELIMELRTLEWLAGYFNISEQTLTQY